MSESPEPLSLLPHRVRAAAGAPQGAVVLLHGRGADEHDLFGLLDIFDPARRWVGVTPGAPLHLEPGGRHWYRFREVGFPEPTSFHATMATLVRFLDGLPAALGVPWSRTVIGGFSQGTVMAYAAGLARGRRFPAGILAMSGFIPTVEGFELDLDSRAGFPVCLSHGSLDPVIPVEFAHSARERLSAAGLRVELHESRSGHGIDPRTLAPVQEWLSATLAASPATPTTS